ncbi:putative MATE family efflux protein [Ruminiclostridium sufflavum DSM 19573]|uniref:Probable multidrug resistance protein NorM n=1 Tax=Ruminiclostridium sufflavum DSM 19573 TaxID=1121337 RepID=A0A318XL95_9FIRM|nr:MATE family efflux transporter [Ruminiclostridium sufflavum]PYG88398.1 putative MATE family efflux protein [Ruminiclostridium sufflavum DSM 19573]
MYTRKDLLRLFIPALMEQLLSTAIGVVNTMMVSGLGAFAVSAVGIVDSINIVAMNVFMAVSTGATVVISQHLGADNRKAASRTAAQSVSSVVLLSALTGLGLYLFGEQIINILFGNAEQIVKSAAKTYLICSAVSYPFLGMFNVFTGILRANNNFRASMIAAVASNIVNVLVGAVCIFYLKLGVLGAGIGMISARFFGALILMHPLFTDNRINISKQSYRITLNILKPVLYIGVPAGLDSLIFNGGKLLVQTFITSLGTAALAANTIAGSMNNIINIPGNAVAIVSVSVIGYYAGAGLHEDLRKMIKKLTLYAMILLGGVSLAFFPFVESFLKLYTPPDDVLKMALHVTYLTLICIPVFWPAGFIVSACLRSTGDSVFVTMVSISSMWLVRVFGGYVLVRYTALGLMGIWIAWCFDWVTRGVPYCGRVLSRRYEKHLPHIET